MSDHSGSSPGSGMRDEGTNERACVICDEDAEGARCDDCGKPLCSVCIVQRGLALCEDCDVLDDGDDEGGWCVDCGETFRYDDCGGYNPPCKCGLHCRSCHDEHEDDYEDDYDYHNEAIS